MLAKSYAIFKKKITRDAKNFIGPRRNYLGDLLGGEAKIFELIPMNFWDEILPAESRAINSEMPSYSLTSHLEGYTHLCKVNYVFSSRSGT